MKRPEPKRHEAIRKEADTYFLERTSIDEEMDQADTSLTNPASSPYYPANTDPDFKPEIYIKNL